MLVDCFKRMPEYCRLTRVIRDIPGTDIVDGNKVTNFRQLVERERWRGRARRAPISAAREIRKKAVAGGDLRLDSHRYASSIGEEVFLQFITEEREIAGFLRLSLPAAAEAPMLEELRDCAMIREVHVYGLALGIGSAVAGRAQHAGLGTRLIEKAAEIAAHHGYARLAVISAIGTRDYYRKRGFADGALYQMRDLNVMAAQDSPLPLE